MTDGPPCPTCSPVLAFREAVDDPHHVDVVGVTAALLRRLADGGLREIRGDVPVADMIDLAESDTKYTIVSYLHCLTCERTIFWGLCIRGAPILKYVDHAEAETALWSDVPPREQWARPERPPLTTLDVVDVGPGAWYLMRRGDGRLLLDARYSHSAVIDDSAVIMLTDTERAAYDAGGSDYLDDLQRRIHNSAPYLEDSTWYARNLTRLYGDVVTAAIRTFLAS